MIVTDDQATRDTFAVMPTVVRDFVDGGVRFTNAFATTPQCCPSRASIFTGRYAHNHGIRENHGGDLGQFDQSTTIQRYLTEAGYRTAMFGKYLNDWDISQAPPYFEEWAHLPHGYYGAIANVNGEYVTVGGYSTTFLGDLARNFISSNEADDERPWFLYLSLYAPHQPSIPDDRYRDAIVPSLVWDPAKQEEDRSDKPLYVQEATHRREVIERFYARQLRTLLSVDDVVAGLRADMVALGEDENTLSIFLSDNGLQLGDHGLRGKGSPYDPSVQIPLVMRWPARLTGGVIDDRLAANIDIAPTVLEAAGLTPGHEFDGRSLLQEWDRPRLLLESWGTSKDSELRWASLRSKTEQYVEYYASDMSTVIEREYYDIAGDPWQLVNLFGDDDPLNDPYIRLDLGIQLSRDRECSGSDCP